MTKFSIREATRLLNSTPRGQVTTEYRLKRLMVGFGMKKPKLIELGARLLLEGARITQSQNAKHRERERQRQVEMATSGRNIGQIPMVQNPERRRSCKYDLAKFIMTYAPEGKDPFSNDHLRVIKRIENAILHGGRFVEAVYRGFGKSTISELTAVWAVLYGHKKYIPLIGANESRAAENLNSIKGTFESEMLLEDFPEVCFPIQCLEGITQRCHGQLHDGKLTHIQWSSDTLVFAFTPGAATDDGEYFENDAAGSIITACGITSSKIRGMKKRRGDGVQLRPDFAIIDDPQDEESAASPSQVDKRLNILRKAILKSAGHKSGLSVVMPCTVIQQGDLVDQLLDPIKNPAWQGERIPFIRKWADKHEEMWLGEYARLRNTYNPEDPDDQIRARKSATEYYREHRDEMDAGCAVSWEYCYSEQESEISAVQHAYNALIDDGMEVFASEFQNQPLSLMDEEGQMTSEDIKQNGLKRNEIGAGHTHLTMFVDVQQKLLYYTVCAWKEDFTGQIIDYGTFPDQKKSYFTLRQVTRTLGRTFQGMGQEGLWYAGLKAVTQEYLNRDWQRDDGAVMRINKLLIDANDGNARNVIYEFCRQSNFAALVMPSLGRGVKASDKPFSEYSPKPGEQTGLNWRIPITKGRKEVRHVLSDVNYWKSFVRSRFKTAMGDPGCLSVFGGTPFRRNASEGGPSLARDSGNGSSSMLQEQMVSEYSIPTEGRGRKVDEWKVRPSATENHWWDCVVGCAIAASIEGVQLAGTGRGHGRPRRQRKRFTQADMERRVR